MRGFLATLIQSNCITSFLFLLPPITINPFFGSICEQLSDVVYKEIRSQEFSFWLVTREVSHSYEVTNNESKPRTWSIASAGLASYVMSLRTRTGDVLTDQWNRSCAWFAYLR